MFLRCGWAVSKVAWATCLQMFQSSLGQLLHVIKKGLMGIMEHIMKNWIFQNDCFKIILTLINQNWNFNIINRNTKNAFIY